jgi:excisionase family DNA binding protein
MLGPARGGPQDGEGRMAGARENRTIAGGLLTVAEVADVLRVSTMTVYRLIQSGEIAAIRVGKSYRITESVLQGYLASGEVQVDDANG